LAESILKPREGEVNRSKAPLGTADPVMENVSAFSLKSHLLEESLNAGSPVGGSVWVRFPSAFLVAMWAYLLDGKVVPRVCYGSTIK
jgi:hypothetical protein